MFEILRRAVVNIICNKGRMLLTLFGIAVGTAAVIITISIGNAGSSAIDHEIDGLGMGGLSVTLADPQAPLTKKQLTEIRHMPFVRSAMPLMFETTSIRFNDEFLPVYLWGIDQSAESAVSLKIRYGRFFNEGDIASDSKVCLVDEKFAGIHYGSSRITGREMIIHNGATTEKYTIIGVIKTGSGLLQNVMGSVIPDFIYIPYSTMQKNLSSENFTQIVVRTVDENYSKESGVLSDRLSHETGWKDAYAVSDLSRQKDSLNNIVSVFSLVLSAVGAISLIVAGINIMNVMLVAVKERTREIGIKKSIGASPGIIIAEFLCEAMIISLAGGIGGILISAICLGAGKFFLGLTITPDYNIMLLMLFFSVVTGTVFGLYPAVKAASFKPVDALRYY